MSYEGSLGGEKVLIELVGAMAGRLTEPTTTTTSEELCVLNYNWTASGNNIATI